MKPIVSKYAHRDDSIAIAKGIGIMLVVLGHCTLAQGSMFLSHFVNMFHVSIFFFVSGYFFSMKYTDDKWLFTKKRLKNLYLPFIKFELIFILLHNTFYRLNLYNDKYGFDGVVSTMYGWKDMLLHIKDTFLFVGVEQLLGAYWFIPALFFASILALFSTTIIKKVLKLSDMKNAIIVIIAFIILAMIRTDVQIHTWQFNPKVLLATSIFMTGFVARQYTLPKKYSKLAAVIAFLAIVTCATLIHPMSLLDINVSWEVPYFYVQCIIGCWGTVCLSKLITKTKWTNLFIFIGQNTMAILTWHFLCFKLVNLLKIYYYGMDFKRLAEFPIITEHQNICWIVMYCILGIVVPLIIPYYKQTRLTH